MARIRIDNTGRYASDESYHARITSTGKTGSIDKKYISEAKQKEIQENGFGYVNQPQERVV